MDSSTYTYKGQFEIVVATALFKTRCSDHPKRTFTEQKDSSTDKSKRKHARRSWVWLMHRPGIEPGAGRHSWIRRSRRWQRPILPLNHQCIMKAGGTVCSYTFDKRRGWQGSSKGRNPPRGTDVKILEQVVHTV